MTICGVWVATIILVSVGIVEINRMYIYAASTVLLLFVLGFTRS